MHDMTIMSVLIVLMMIAFGIFTWQANSNFARRLLALAIDVILAVLAMELSAKIVRSLEFVADQAMDLYLQSSLLFTGELYLRNPSFAILLLAVPIIISAIFESSAYRATPGKLIMRMAVSDRHHSRPSFPVALLRNSVKWISLSVWPLLIVTVVLVYTKGKALHDYVAKSSSLVLGKGTTRKLGQTRLYEVDTSTRFHFENHEDAGTYGETLLIKELERLKSKGVVRDYGSTGNMVFNQKNFELDAYSLIPGVGIVVLEAKFFSGKVYPSGKPHWDNIKDDGINAPKKNPCLQLERSTDLFIDVLESKGLAKWPVYSIVVLTHPSVQTVFIDGEPQYSVLCTNMLEDFLLHDMEHDESIAFNESDCQKVQAALKEHYQDYVDRSAEYAG